MPLRRDAETRGRVYASNTLDRDQQQVTRNFAGQQNCAVCHQAQRITRCARLYHQPATAPRGLPDIEQALLENRRRILPGDGKKIKLVR
jgi:hypothetical protein